MNVNQDEELLSALNPQQREAVTTVGGAVLVVAGAGSGKTRIITYRAAHLLMTGEVRPENLLAVTFTNKAAAEMKNRIHSLVSGNHRLPMIVTFHAFGSHFLRRHAGLAGLGRDFHVYDDEDQMNVVRECCKELLLPEGRYEARDVHYFLKWQRSRLEPSEIFDPNIKNISAMYSKKLKQLNAVDFDDLLKIPLQLLKDNPDLVQRYREQFRFVMVDEYQDTNEVQFELLKILTGKEGNILVVGDGDQSIYKFRGARADNIDAFVRDYPAVKIIKLEQNYRSTKTIIKAAQAVITRNTGRIKKELWTENDPGEPVEVYQAYDEYDEASFVTLRVMAALKRMSASAIGVLYRANAQSRALEESFVKAQIPHRIVGAVGFYERREIKDLISFLRLHHNPHDNVSALRVINVPPRGIGRKMLEQIKYDAELNDISIYESASRINEKPAQSFVALFDATLHADPASGFLQQLMDRVGYLEYLRKDDSQRFDEREENIREFLRYLQERELDPEFDLAAFIGDLPLQSRTKEDGDAVTLLTVHSAKGLEFGLLHVIGMEEGLFPHSRSLDKAEDLEEERRLFYVAMTRAKEKLTLSWAQKRGMYGNSMSNRPSRFLEEIPSWFKVNKISERFQSFHPPEARRSSRGKDPAASLAGAANQEIGNYRVGCTVRHEKLGRGTVLNVEGTAADCKLTVRFPEGVKKILTRYATVIVEK